MLSLRLLTVMAASYWPIDLSTSPIRVDLIPPTPTVWRSSMPTGRR